MFENSTELTRQIEVIVEQFIVQKSYSIKEIKLMPNQGDQHHVFYVATNQGALVARVSKENCEKGYQQLKKEELVIKLVRNHNLLAPQVISVDKYQNRAIMLQEFIPGKLAKDDVRSWEVLGKYAKINHSIQVQGFGEELEDEKILKFKDSWQRFLNYNIEELDDCDPFLKLGAFTKLQQSQVRDAFTKLLSNSFNFGLVHNDLASRNMIETEKGFFLIDWTCVEANIVPHWDLVEILFNNTSPEFLEAFRSGYGITKQKFVDIIRESKVLLLSRSCDKLRWAIDRSQDRIPEFIKNLQRAYCMVFVD